jgi:ring-1,2-phenylacetyl-CoA epoxidase subunit PaaD
MSQPVIKADPAGVPERVLTALEAVVDPEIPVLTIGDLGILREVRMDGEQPVVTITPTYSGCPAMVEIRDSIHKTLLDAGFDDHRVETRLSPAWTTDWMSEEGRKKLLDYGIAPPPVRGEGAPPTPSSDFGDLVGAAP